MIDLDKELKRAQDEMRSGSLDSAIAILTSLQDMLSVSPSPPGLTEEDRLRGLVKVLNNLGVVQKNRGALDEATRSLAEALEIADKLDNESVRMRTGILSNLGLLYSRCKEYGKALEAFDRALVLTKKHPDACSESIIIKLHNNRALFFVRFGEPERAREELAQALEAGREGLENGNEIEREAWLNANLAMIHAELGDEEIYNPSLQEELYRQARTMFLHSAELYEQEGYLLNRLKQIVNAAEINIRLRSPEEARRHLNEARREAERLNDSRLICEIAHVSCELSLLTGDGDQINNRVREALKILAEANPVDMTSRVIRLEGILRRAGRRDALKLITDFRNLKGPESPKREKTPR